MIGEDLQKFSGSRVMRTSAIGRVPIRNLPKMKKVKEIFSTCHKGMLKTEIDGAR